VDPVADAAGLREAGAVLQDELFDAHQWTTPGAADKRKDIYVLTEKGLDLITVVFSISLWSAKYDRKSSAQEVLRP
jgi:hypothetical protein